MHLQGGHNIEQIRRENYEQCGSLIKGGNSEKKQLADVRIRAGEGDQKGQLTTEITDCIEFPKR